MRHKLRSQVRRAVYEMRKAIMEPVFGQIKGIRLSNACCSVAEFSGALEL